MESTPYEDEEFNRVEMESRIKQEYIRAMRKTTREEKISRPAVYEVPTAQFMSISVDDYLKLSDELALARVLIRELGDRLSRLEKTEQDGTYVYASSLATAIWQKHYMKESPKFALLDTTEGVLTQIDNMTCGLVREKPAQPEREQGEPVAWMTINAYGEEDDIHYENPEGHLPEGWTYLPLYTHLPQAQPAPQRTEQDCMGWFGYDTGLRLWFEANKGDDGAIPLYKDPPQRTWVGLTEEEIGMAFRAVFPVGGVVFTNGATEFAQTIERKLKEKNT